MTKLYRKSPLAFALVWIGGYIILFSTADSVSASMGIPGCAETAIGGIMTLLAFGWMKKQGLLCRFGLTKVQGTAKEYLWYLPLAAITTTNLWWGLNFSVPLWEGVFSVTMMMCVGFLEEIIFRGFLFRALEKEGIRFAVTVSSLTFGIGHVSNLLQGADLVGTLLQICYAVAIGFLFTVLFLRSGSLLPCIVTHAVINSLSIFANSAGRTFLEQAFVAAFLCVVPAGYTLWLLRKKKETL